MKSKSGPRMELSAYINIGAPLRSTVTTLLFPIMPMDWRPDMPIAAYIARASKDPKPNHARPRTILSKTSTCQIKKTTSPRCDPINPQLSSTASFASTMNRDMHLAEGTLETQNSLLQQLARQKNAAKELTCQGSGQVQSRCTSLGEGRATKARFSSSTSHSLEYEGEIGNQGC